MILCQIDGFEQNIAINETEEFFFNSKHKIDKNKLITQHTNFVNVVKKYLDDVFVMESNNNCPEQTFVRDVAFHIGDTICISNMFSDVRKQETSIIKDTLISSLKKEKIYDMNNIIEGGDVLVCDRTVFVGVGRRTSMEAVEELKNKFQDFTIIPIYLKNNVLHLDCALGIINNIWAVIYKDGIDSESYEILSRYFNFIHLSEKEAKNLATNFLKIHNVIICDKRNHSVNKKIAKLGYNIEELEFDEISKLGGSFHCCSLEKDGEVYENKNYLRYRGEKLYYRDINLNNLIEGSTPLNICHLDEIEYRVRSLKNYFATSIKKNKYTGSYTYALATKANYNWDVLEKGIQVCDAIEVSSYADLCVVKKIFDNLKISKKIICNGNKDLDYLNLIVKMSNDGFNIEDIIDSLTEYNYLLSQDLINKLQIGLRINLKNLYIKNKDHAIADRFGLTDDDIDYINKNFNDKFIMKTIHFHQRASLYYEEKALENIKYVFNNYYYKLSKIYDTLDTFNTGGGCPYEKIKEFDYLEYANIMVKLIKELADDKGISHPNIIQENGRYTVSDAIFYVMSIQDVKRNNGNTWYVLNDSIIVSLPDSWALHEEFLFTPINKTDNMIPVLLAGNTCDCDDVYYYQGESQCVYLPSLDNNESINIGVFGVGAYNEILSGINGAHHCLTRNKVRIVMDSVSKGKLVIRANKKIRDIDFIINGIKQ